MIEELVIDGAAELGLELPAAAAGLIRAYYDNLRTRSRQFNLTAIEGEEDTARLHFLDSLALMKFADFRAAKVADVGTGAGFPGLPLLIANPDMELALIDSTGKKIDFLRETLEKMGLTADTICARAEELGQRREYRERYDAAVSRAVAALPVLVELCLPLVKVGGAFYAMKSADTDAELAESRGAVKALGGIIAAVHEYTLPGTEIRRRVIEIKKTAETDMKYPRRFPRIKKEPLR